MNYIYRIITTKIFDEFGESYDTYGIAAFSEDGSEAGAVEDISLDPAEVTRLCAELEGSDICNEQLFMSRRILFLRAERKHNRDILSQFAFFS